VLLGTYWELEKLHWRFIGNIMGTHCGQKSKKSKAPLTFLSRNNGIKLRCYWEHLGNLKNTLGIQWDHVGTHCEQ